MKFKFAFCLVSLMLIGVIQSASGQGLPADLSSSFGSNGFVTQPQATATDLLDYGQAYLVAGRSTLHLYSKRGGLLQQITPCSAPNNPCFSIEKVAEQIDPNTGQSKIIGVGVVNTSISPPQNEIVVVRYNPDLSMDTTFGKGGFVQFLVNANKYFHFPGGITCQPDGKIVIVGSVTQSNIPYANFNQFIVRLDANGFFDPNFGSNGVTETAIGTSSFANSISISIQGIYVGGNSVGSGYSNSTITNYDFNGQLNPYFHKTGIVAFHGSPAAVLADNNSITVAGIQNGNVSNFGLIRLNLQGQLDPFFGTGGFSLRLSPSPNYFQLKSLARQPNGYLVVTGLSADPNNKQSLLIGRYLDDGSPDPNFTASCCQPMTGIRLFNINRGSSEAGLDLIAPATGNLVVAGYSNYNSTNYNTLLITQFNGF